MHFNFEEVMTVDLKIRGPFAARNDLLVIQIVEGALTGTGAYADKLSGKVKAPSGDALEIGPNGVFKRNVRLLAEMDDDSFLLMQYGGRTRPNETYIERVAKGKVVNGDEVYFMIQPSFETSSSKYNWLNESIFVGKMGSVLMPTPEADGRVNYTIAEVS